MDCSYRVSILGRSICFADRYLEVERLLDLARGIHPVPIAIYGPEGCGKTTLLRYLIHRLSSSDYTAIYIDALAQDLREALEVPKLDIGGVVKAIARDLGYSLPSALSRLVSRAVEELWTRLRLFGGGLVVAIDDVYRAIGLENVDRYTKMLYEWITWRVPRYGVKNLLVVLTTSEGLSKRVLARHTYADIYMVWNLDLPGYGEFVEQLDAHQRPEDLYTVTGGSPRLTIEIARYGWDVEKVRKLYSEKIASTLRAAFLDRDRLRSLVEDPDADHETAARLEELGLMIELYRSSSLSSIPRDRDLGIGREWAWQTPLFRDIVSRIAREL